MKVLSPQGNGLNEREYWEIRIDKEADIVAVRQRVRELAKEHRFDQFEVAALTTAASELSRNVWVHAQKGTRANRCSAQWQRESAWNFILPIRGPALQT